MTTRSMAVSVAFVVLQKKTGTGVSALIVIGRSKRHIDVLDVNFSLFLSASLLRQSCEPFLEIIPASLDVTWFTFIILRIKRVSCERRISNDVVHTGKKFLMSDVAILRSKISFLLRKRICGDE
jgi:hypothetical protein